MTSADGVLAPGRNLVLIGMMGAGKTRVGELLAQRLGRPFADTDALVEAATGMTVAEIFATDDERGFRRHEAEAVRRASALRGQVVAVGGGAVGDPANLTHLRGTGDLVWLDADVAELRARVGDGADRPLLAGPAAGADQRLDLLRRERDGAYRRAAAHVVDTTGRTPEEVADAVLGWARGWPGLLTQEEERAL